LLWEKRYNVNAAEVLLQLLRNQWRDVFSSVVDDALQDGDINIKRPLRWLT
jgi:hypothetical protein